MSIWHQRSPPLQRVFVLLAAEGRSRSPERLNSSYSWPRSLPWPSSPRGLMAFSRGISPLMASASAFLMSVLPLEAPTEPNPGLYLKACRGMRG